MAKQRQTIDAAALVRQAEQRGKEAGRRELAHELKALLRPGTVANLRDLDLWLQGYAAGGRVPAAVRDAMESMGCWFALERAIVEAMEPDF